MTGLRLNCLVLPHWQFLEVIEVDTGEEIFIVSPIISCAYHRDNCNLRFFKYRLFVIFFVFLQGHFIAHWPYLVVFAEKFQVMSYEL